MTMPSRYLVAFFFSICAFFPVGAAEFSVSERNACTTALHLEGELVSSDSASFERFLNAMIAARQACPAADRMPFALWLDSEGGDLDEALKIGRIVRAKELETVVAKREKCLSSCVLILAAGVRRTPVGVVGVHRPYFKQLDHTLSAAQIRALRQRKSSELREYLEEMDVSAALLDLMLATDPREMKVLSESELALYRLSGSDANQEEKRVAGIAAFYNLTSAEYRKKDALVTARCKSGPYGFTDDDCRESEMLQISVGELLARKERARARCASGSDQARYACLKRVIVLGQ